MVKFRVEVTKLHRYCQLDTDKIELEVHQAMNTYLDYLEMKNPAMIQGRLVVLKAVFH